LFSHLCTTSSEQVVAICPDMAKLMEVVNYVRPVWALYASTLIMIWLRLDDLKTS
jgi:hypothetical protein